MFPEGFEWDLHKNEANKLKHKISFEVAILIFQEKHIEREFLHFESGEIRKVTVGVLFGKEISVISTRRGVKSRIISARRARDNERDEFWNHVGR